MESLKYSLASLKFLIIDYVIKISKVSIQLKIKWNEPKEKTEVWLEVAYVIYIIDCSEF